jgi:hypothetical protein
VPTSPFLQVGKVRPIATLVLCLAVQGHQHHASGFLIVLSIVVHCVQSPDLPAYEVVLHQNDECFQFHIVKWSSETRKIELASTSISGVASGEMILVAG